MSYAIGSIIERIIDVVKQKVREIYAKSREATLKFRETIVESPKASVSDESFAKAVLTSIVKLHVFLSREETVVNAFRRIGFNVQRLQSSLEDSLSALSLLLEFIFALSIVLILVITWSS